MRLDALCGRLPHGGTGFSTQNHRPFLSTTPVQARCVGCGLFPIKRRDVGCRRTNSPNVRDLRQAQELPWRSSPRARAASIFGSLVSSPGLWPRHALSGGCGETGTWVDTTTVVGKPDLSAFRPPLPILLFSSPDRRNKSVSPPAP